MMNFKGHFIGSAIMFMLVLLVVKCADAYFDTPIAISEESHLFFYALFFMYAGLMPDLDTDSKIEDFTYRFVLLILIGLILSGNYFYGAIIGAVSCVPRITHHRQLMHNPFIGLAIAIVVVYFLGMAYGIFVLLGFLSHLLLDHPFFRRTKPKKCLV